MITFSARVGTLTCKCNVFGKELATSSVTTLVDVTNSVLSASTVIQISVLSHHFKYEDKTIEKFQLSCPVSKVAGQPFIAVVIFLFYKHSMQSHC